MSKTTQLVFETFGLTITHGSYKLKTNTKFRAIVHK